MESEEPFGDEMPNFDICGTVFKELFKDIDVLDVDAKTETAASSKNSGRKSPGNEQNKRNSFSNWQVTLSHYYNVYINNNCQFFKNQFLFCNLIDEIRL